MVWKTTLVMLTILFSANTYAQNYKVYNINTILNENNRSANTFSPNELSEIRSLLYDLQPTLYLNGTEIKTTGNNPAVKAEVESLNTPSLFENSSLFSSVKLLSIKLHKQNSYSTPLDLEKLSGFSSLKYIYIECVEGCSTSNFEKMFKNTGNIKVLYLIAQPE